MTKLIFDTNVCGTLLTPAYEDDLADIKARISRRFKIVISPQTLVELLDALTKSDSSHFELHKDRLRLMAGGGRPVFLMFPAAFALKRILGLNSPAVKFGPADFEQWFRIVLRAKSRDEMLQGFVTDPRGDPSQTYGLNPEEISRQQKVGKAEHKKRLQLLQASKHPMPSGIEWAKRLALDLGHRIAKEQASRLYQGLDAAYRYDKELCRIASRPNYNFDKHDGDWIDYHQLFYLCDPQLCLLTDDKGLVRRVGDSPQKDRILVMREYLTVFGFSLNQ